MTKRRAGTFIVTSLLLAAACGGSTSDGGQPGGGGTGGGSTVIQWTLAAQTTPVQTTVAAGTAVSWHSADGTTHTVNADGNPPPTAFTLPAGATSAPQTFGAPGTYKYHCTIHPGMRGTLVVQ
jgi:plastocyanin